MIIVVCDEKTKEIVAAINTENNSDSLLEKGFTIKFYENTEPILKHGKSGRLYLDERFSEISSANMEVK